MYKSVYYFFNTTNHLLKYNGNSMDLISSFNVERVACSFTIHIGIIIIFKQIFRRGL